MYHLPPSIFNDPDEPWLKAAATSLSENRVHDLWVDSGGSLRVTMSCPPLLCCNRRGELEASVEKVMGIMERFIEGQISWSDGTIPVWFIDLPQSNRAAQFATLANYIALDRRWRDNPKIQEQAERIVRAQAKIDLTRASLTLRADERDLLNRIIMTVCESGYEGQVLTGQRDHFDRQMHIVTTADVANTWVEQRGRIPSVPELERAVQSRMLGLGSGKRSAAVAVFTDRLSSLAGGSARA